MHQLLPIIRRVRRPLIVAESVPDRPPVVVPPASPVTPELPPVEAVAMPPAAPAEIAAPELTPVLPPPKRKKKNDNDAKN
jgi:hypothetical protein